MSRLRALALSLGRSAAAALLAGLVGCVLDEVDLEGKSCPCAAGFECDLDTRRCVRAGAPDGGGLDAGLADAEAPDGGGPVSCTTDRDCGNPPERVCVDGACAPGCAAGGSTCEAPSSCDMASGHCLVQGPCATSMDCAPPLSICLGGQCAPGCTVSTGGCELDAVCEASTGACGPSPACADASACPISHFCDGSTCRRRCNEPGATCRGRSTCNADTGRCEGALGLGVDCQGMSDAACASGLCLGIRRNLVTSEFCSRPCGASSDCPLGFGCIPVSGAGHCIPNRVLEGMGDERSRRSGSACSAQTNEQCQSVFCEGSRCVERCSRERDCQGLGGTCVAATQSVGGDTLVIPRCLTPFPGAGPGEPCTIDANCANGLCDVGASASTCARLCCAERDCPGDQACVAIQTGQTTLRVCRPRGAGERAIGAPCDQDAQCRSGVCGPADPSNPGGVRVCTSYCCTDADCTDILGGRCRASQGPFPDVLLGRCVR